MKPAVPMTTSARGLKVIDSMTTSFGVVARRLEAAGFSDSALREAFKSHPMHPWPAGPAVFSPVYPPRDGITQQQRILVGLFHLGETVGESDLHSLLGSQGLAFFEQTGLLIRNDGGYRCTLTLLQWRDAWRVADRYDQTDAPDSVFRPNTSTARLACAVERIRPRTIHRALELGVGSGAVLLELASRCELAVGTDISPTQTEVAYFNAVLNGRENVELAVTDDPVTVGGHFDLIAFNSPRTYGVYSGAGYGFGTAEAGERVVASSYAAFGTMLSVGGVAHFRHEIKSFETYQQMLEGIPAARGLTVLFMVCGPMITTTPVVKREAGWIKGEDCESGHALVYRRGDDEAPRVSSLQMDDFVDLPACLPNEWQSVDQRPR